MTGRIDRVDEDADGYVIVDYKTGNPKSQKTADDSLQLSIYAMALGSNKPVKTLIFQNLEDNSTVETTRSPEDLRETEAKIAQVAAGIAAGQFEAKIRAALQLVRLSHDLSGDGSDRARIRPRNRRRPIDARMPDATARRKLAQKVRGRLRVPVVLRSEEKLLLFLLCGLLRGFLCSLLLSCHVVYSPFPSVMDHCDITSSQFVLCIELSKKIVKKKTRIKLSNSVTRPWHRGARDCDLRRSVRRCEFASRISHVRWNPHEHWRFASQHFLARRSRASCSFFVEDGCAIFAERSAPKIFFHR